MEREAVGIEAKALEARTALADAWSRKAGEYLTDTRGDLTLVVERLPERFANRDGVYGGISCRVQLHYHHGQPDGYEVPIDQTRRVWNPPMQVVVSRAEYDAEGKETKARVLRHDPMQALLDVLWDSVHNAPNPERWGLPGGTVTTIFAVAPGGNGTVSSSNTTYSTARTGGTLGVQDNHSVGQILSGSTYFCFEGFLEFDTTAIGSDAVSDVVLSLDGNFDQSSAADFTANAREDNYGGGAPTTADWESGATVGNKTLLATWDSVDYLGGYNAFTSEAAFLTIAGWGGSVQIILTSDRFEAGTAPTVPTGSQRVIFTDADASGTTTDPKLDVTHAPPPAVSGSLTLLGVG